MYFYKLNETVFGTNCLRCLINLMKNNGCGSFFPLYTLQIKKCLSRLSVIPTMFLKA